MTNTYSHIEGLKKPYKYKYNGKEIQETGMYDYGWRMYMPDIARWNGMDQLSEKFISSSPYAYVMNNPVSFFDPDGRDKQSSGNWLQDMWNATDSYSYWTNNGNGSFVGGEVPGGMSHQNFTNFYNFLAGGGTGRYTYWTGGANLGGNNIQGLDGHTVNIKSNDNNWYDTSGKANWFFGAGATISGVKGGLNAEDMFGKGMRGGLSGNYQLKGRNLSQFGKMAPTKASMPVSSLAKWGGIAGKFSFGAGIIMNEIAVSDGTISREKANLDATIGAYGLTGAGIIPSLLYFGIDAFYPGGWVGASETAARTEANEQQMTGHPFFSNSALKF